MPKQVYFYNVVGLAKNSKKTKHSGFYTTHHISTKLYNSDDETTGYAFSVNNIFNSNGVLHVTTTTTYETDDGTLVCNWSYKTNSDYLIDKITTTPTFTGGKYEKKKVKMELDVFPDEVGTRKLTITY
jgi:hypothetical protein